jgi:hypothetical protein
MKDGFGLEEMWKKAVTIYFKVLLSQHFLESIE